MTQAYQEKVKEFCDKLRQKRIVGSYAAAKGTVEILKQLVSSTKAENAQMLLEEVRSVGVRIQSAKPVELVIGNVVRRVMYIIREEMDEQQEEEQTVSPLEGSSVPTREGGLSRALNKQTTTNRWSRTFSLHNLLDQEIFDESVALASAAHSADKDGQKQQVQEDFEEKRHDILEGIHDLIDELKDIDASIAAHAPEHIHSNEVVLTFGYSRTVLQFLKRAKEKRNFQVIVSEGSPKSEGYKLAAELERLHIPTTVIADAACYAMMARTNKVIISAHALLADGGAMANVGTSILAAAAKRHNVPVVVLAGIYKLSPNFPHEPGITFNEFGDPSEILPFRHESIFAAERAEANFSIMGENKETALMKPFLQVHNPRFDYIPSDRISLFVTDHGHGFMPSYVYRQLSEFYNRQDYQLSKQLDAAMSR